MPMTLTHAQKEAVAHNEGPCLVLAGPGSGKTLTIAKRIEYLIQVYKVRPEEILVITFTRYAAKEMKERFCRVVGNGESPVVFGTFHAIYYWILKWAYRLGPDNILSEQEKTRMMLYAMQKADPFEEEFPRTKEQARELSEEIGHVKNNCLDIALYCPPHHDAEKFHKCYRFYEEQKRQERKLDFDDILYQCMELFLQRPDILRKWQERFRYLMIDEFQDINLVQYRVAKMLAAPDDHLFVVGDDDQSIYRFRGASPGIMRQFQEDYPQARQILLDVNYRSGARIVRSALRVIGHNQNRFPKAICPRKSEGCRIHIQEVSDAREESLYILAQVQQQVRENKALDDIAVLFRTTDNARAITETFAEYQVPFWMRETPYDIYGHFAAQDMVSYLRIAQGKGKRSDFLRVANRPNRYLGRDSMRDENVTFESLGRFYCDKAWMQERIWQFEEDMEAIRGKTPYAAIVYLRKKVGYDFFLREYTQARGLDYDEQKETLDEIQERAKGFETAEAWFAHIAIYQEELQAQGKKEKGNPQGKVAFLTMHGAKGLEYDTVFIIQANEGNIPYRKAALAEEIEEERRLFYVAVTRAKNRLTISRPKKKNGKDQLASRFIGELTGSQTQENDVE